MTMSRPSAKAALREIFVAISSHLAVRRVGLRRAQRRRLVLAAAVPGPHDLAAPIHLAAGKTPATKAAMTNRPRRAASVLVDHQLLAGVRHQRATAQRRHSTAPAAQAAAVQVAAVRHQRAVGHRRRLHAAAIATAVRRVRPAAYLAASRLAAAATVHRAAADPLRHLAEAVPRRRAAVHQAAHRGAVRQAAAHRPADPVHPSAAVAVTTKTMTNRHPAADLAALVVQIRTIAKMINQVAAA